MVIGYLYLWTMKFSVYNGLYLRGELVYLSKQRSSDKRQCGSLVDLTPKGNFLIVIVIINYYNLSVIFDTAIQAPANYTFFCTYFVHTFALKL